MKVKLFEGFDDVVLRPGDNPTGIGLLSQGWDDSRLGLRGRRLWAWW